ncbi:helix-turn-helix domain-containing protein [Microbacterium paraoxydans]|uniref:XRE family transcriptional regulator n=1 Tax=Microbacterium paraoxydans TaxID=199592 RepID=A0ABS5INK7_9MICO|nr:hypothetical protein [Microbacterium paraoxydans]MBS0023847.1 hypothetical protein [Microbacterium paraoxydans]
MPLDPSPTAPAIGFAEALREAIAARGTSLAQLSERLRHHGNPVSIATLSCWQSGTRQPEGPSSLAAVDDLEALLLLEPGALQRRIGHSRRAGRTPKPRTPCEDWTREGPILDTFRALGVDPAASFNTHSLHAVCTTDDHGRVDAIHYRAIIRPPAGRAPLLPYIDLPSRPTDVRPQLDARTGCRVVQHHEHPSHVAFGMLLAVDEPPEHRHAALIEFTVRYPLPYPRDRVLTFASLYRTPELLLHVDFTGARRPPAWIEEVTVIDGEEQTVPLPPRQRSATTVRAPFPPGLIALRWGHSDRDDGADPLPL